MPSQRLHLIRRKLGLSDARRGAVPKLSAFIARIEGIPVSHQVQRIRHDPAVRDLVVQQVSRLTPGMLRITLEGRDLAGFQTHSPDDHVKLLIPSRDGEVVRRDYTPRAFDRQTQLLTIDFAVHEAGPATEWAEAARVGDRLSIAGPKMSIVIPQDFAWWVLIGDEASLPSIARRLEEMAAGTPVTAIISVGSAMEEQDLRTSAQLDLHWVHRPAAAADDASAVIEKLRSMALRPGEGFVWIAGESSFARALRTEIVENRRHPKEWVKARGYWKKGVADSHDKIED